MPATITVRTFVEASFEDTVTAADAATAKSIIDQRTLASLTQLSSVRRSQVVFIAGGSWISLAPNQQAIDPTGQSIVFNAGPGVVFAPADIALLIQRFITATGVTPLGRRGGSGEQSVILTFSSQAPTLTAPQLAAISADRP